MPHTASTHHPHPLPVVVALDVAQPTPSGSVDVVDEVVAPAEQHHLVVLGHEAGALEALGEVGRLVVA